MADPEILSSPEPSEDGFEQAKEYAALVTEKEPNPMETQYEARLNTLDEAGLVERLSTGEVGIRAIDGKEYPVPSWEEIQNALDSKRDIVAQKKAQGFTKLLIVPFGLPLNKQADKLGKVLGNVLEQNGELKNPVEPKKPVTKLAIPAIEYTKDLEKGDTANRHKDHIQYALKRIPWIQGGNHLHRFEGTTKADYLKDRGGWKVLLVEDIKSPSETGHTVSGREQLRPGNNMRQIMRKLKKDSQYRNETGLTPEDWLSLATTAAIENHEIIDPVYTYIDPAAYRRQKLKYSHTQLIGAHHRHHSGGDGTFAASFSLDRNRVEMHSIYETAFSNETRNVDMRNYGVRTAVEII